MAAIGYGAELGGIGVLGAGTTPGARAPRRRLAALLAVVALAGFLVGEQLAPAMSRTVAQDATSSKDDAAVAAGPSVGSGTDDWARRQAEAAGIDVDRTVEGLRHRIVGDAGRPGALMVEDPAYRAAFDDRGVQVGAPGTTQPWFSLSSTVVTRGGKALPPASGPWASAGNVAERPIAAGAVERMTAREGELEWDVVLASEPTGTGDLRVEAIVDGGSARPTPAGTAWRWQRDDGARVDMGEVVVIDATGAVLHRAAPVVEGDTIALDVPAEAIERAVYPLTVDPVIGPEHPVDPDAVSRPSAVSHAAVAFDGTNFLVAWDGSEGLRVARVDGSGVLLDPSGILVRPPYEADGPALAFDGTNYLLTWATGSGLGTDISGTRISPAGEVLDPAGILIGGGPRSDNEPAIAFDGTNHLVVWQSRGQDSFDDVVVAAARVDRAGTVLDPTPLTVSSPGETAYTPAVAFDGTNHLVVWTGDGIRAARVSPSGGVVAPGPFTVSTPGQQQSPTVAFDGTSSLVAWSDFRSGRSWDIYGARVSPAGTVLDPANVPISTATSDQTAPVATRIGARVLVAWQDGLGAGDIYAARVDAGAVLDPAGIAVATGADNQQGPAVAASGGPVMVTFTSGQPADWPRLEGVRVSRAGAVLDPTPRSVARTNNSQDGAAIAFDGTNYLVAWSDNRNHPFRRDIYAARLTPSGENLDPDGIRITSAPIYAGISDLVFDGENFLLAWDGDGAPYRVYVSRIGTDGTLRDPGPIPLSDGTIYEYGVALSSDGTNTLAVWTRQGNLNDIVATRISRSGQVLDPGGLTVASGPEIESSPSVAFDGTNHLVVYDRHRNDGGNDMDVVARRVSPAGAVLDAAARPIDIATPDMAFGGELAWGGQWYYLAWIRQAADGARETVGARLSREVAPLDPTVRLSTGDDVYSPVVTALAGRFLVTWNRYEGSDADVVGIRVNADGSRPDRSPFLVAEAAYVSDVASGDGRWTVAYVHPLHPDYDSDRLFVRTVSPK